MTIFNRYQQYGFTIVELLIVIVVIGVLASVSVAAYNGIQQRAREAQLSSDINVIKKAMEMYKADEGEYPKCPGTANECYFVSSIRPQLVPEYVNAVSSYNFAYVRYQSNDTRWGMRYYQNHAPYDLPDTCKFGVNMISSWYGSAPECK